jgi:hypothetical protein
VKVAVSSAQVKVAPASEVNEKLAAVELLGFVGEELIVAVGATVSMIHVQLGGAGSTLPLASVATTVKVCEPSARPV